MVKTSKKYRLYNGQDIEEVQTIQWSRHRRSTDYTMVKTSKKYRLYNGQDIGEVQTIQWSRHRRSTDYTMVKRNKTKRQTMVQTNGENLRLGTKTGDELKCSRKVTSSYSLVLLMSQIG
jgi:DNA-binding transcriptional MerR regulator